jgi:hypothetical protein
MNANFLLSRKLPSGNGDNYVSHQLLRNLLIEDFLHGQGDDDFVAALEKGFWMYVLATALTCVLSPGERILPTTHSVARTNTLQIPPLVWSKMRGT